MNDLVLSIFPGIDLLGRAFEEEGFCVVRGPDLLWGGDIKTFHPPAGVFAGVVGGPPCQAFSRLRHLVEHNGYKVAEDLIPEFERVVAEAEPGCFVMENVPGSPHPHVDGYLVESGIFNNRQFGAEQNRERVISVGFRGRRSYVLRQLVEWAPINGDWSPACLAAGGRKIPMAIGGSGKLKASRARDVGYVSGAYLAESLRLQGVPDDFLKDAPFTVEGKIRAVNNGVPMDMGRAIARAVRRALGDG